MDWEFKNWQFINQYAVTRSKLRTVIIKKHKIALTLIHRATVQE